VQMRHSLTDDEKLAMGREFKVDRQSHAEVLTLSRRGCNEWLRAIPAVAEGGAAPFLGTWTDRFH
jgi:hypothetical protein